MLAGNFPIQTNTHALDKLDPPTSQFLRNSLTTSTCMFLWENEQMQDQTLVQLVKNKEHNNLFGHVFIYRS